MCAHIGELEGLKIWFKNGAKANIRDDKFGGTVVHCAVLSECPEVLGYVCTEMGDLLIENEEGLNAIDLMRRNGTLANFFADDRVKTAFQSQFPAEEIRPMLDEVAALKPKTKPAIDGRSLFARHASRAAARDFFGLPHSGPHHLELQAAMMSSDPNAALIRLFTGGDKPTEEIKDELMTVHPPVITHVAPKLEIEAIKNKVKAAMSLNKQDSFDRAVEKISDTDWDELLKEDWKKHPERFVKFCGDSKHFPKAKTGQLDELRMKLPAREPAKKLLRA